MPFNEMKIKSMERDGVMNKWKLVVKYSGQNNNVLNIILCWSNGYMEQIAKIILPNDLQIGDNLHTAEEICATLNKRYRKSV